MKMVFHCRELKRQTSEITNTDGDREYVPTWTVVLSADQEHEENDVTWPDIPIGVLELAYVHEEEARMFALGNRYTVEVTLRAPVPAPKKKK